MSSRTSRKARELSVSVTRLIYASTRTDRSAGAVNAIFEASQRNNRRDDISGALIVTNDYFVQLLEGSRPLVSRCMVRIVQDLRHTDIEFISTKSVPHRLFSGWSMRRVEAERLDRALLLSQLIVSAIVPAQLTPEAVEDLFQAASDVSS